jgi:hypothetical protein
MPWLIKDLVLDYSDRVHIGIYHEGAASDYGFSYFITQDPTKEDNDITFSMHRPLLENFDIKYLNPEIPTINSFGFSFGDKGFKRLIDYVCGQFDSAIINLHMTSAHFDRPKEETTKTILECHNSISKSGIKLNITNNFLSDIDLLNFLGSGSINFFPYDYNYGNNRGISSVIDYALSVNKPLAISRSDMFRHINLTSPSICIEDRSLQEIINSGAELLNKYRVKWSNENFIKKYNYIINKVGAR